MVQEGGVNFPLSITKDSSHVDRHVSPLAVDASGVLEGPVSSPTSIENSLVLIPFKEIEISTRGGTSRRRGRLVRMLGRLAKNVGHIHDKREGGIGKPSTKANSSKS